MMALMLQFATLCSSSSTTSISSSSGAQQQCEQMPIRHGFGNRSVPGTLDNCAIGNLPLPESPDPAAACRAACCANSACRSWGLDIKHPGNAAGCSAGKPCCWLERCSGLDGDHLTNCSWGCVSGQAGRKDDPALCGHCTATSCNSCDGPAPAAPPCSTHHTAADCSVWGCVWNKTASPQCSPPPPPPAPPPVISLDLECKLRALILRWATTLQPERAAQTGNLSTLFDALRLGESPDELLACNFSRTDDEFPPIELGYHLPTLGAVLRQTAPGDTMAVHVSADTGDDANSGSQGEPLRSLGAARDLLRRLRRRTPASSAMAVAEVRMSGTFYLDETLELSTLDGNTRWLAAAGSNATISGGSRLEGLDWTKTTVNGHRIYKASIPRNVPIFDTLFDGESDGGRRLVRARYPNGNLERDMRPTGWIPSELDPGMYL